MAMLTATVGPLVGCSTSTIPETPGYPGEPTGTGVPLVVEGSDGESIQAWAREKLLIVTTFGSGSCPAVPRLERIEEDEAAALITITIPNRKGPCTADLAPRTFELEAGRDLNGYVVRVAPSSMR